MIMATVTIYTDGGASGNPGPGGYGALLMYGEHQKELSAGYRLTTNNRMELLAVIVALEALKRPGFQIRCGRSGERLGDGLGAEKLQGQEKPGPVEAFSAGVPPAPGCFFLGQRPCG